MPTMWGAPGTTPPFAPKSKPEKGRNWMPIAAVAGLAILVPALLIAFIASSDSGSTSSTNNSSNRIGTATMTTDVNMRTGAGPAYTSVGILFKDTKVDVLERRMGDTGNYWYKVRVVEYGYGPNEKGYSGPRRKGKNEESDATEGWVSEKHMILVLK